MSIATVPQPQLNHPQQPNPINSPKSTARSSFVLNPFPRRSTSTTSLKRSYQSATPTCSSAAPALKQLGTKLFHRRPSVSIPSVSSTQNHTTTSSTSPSSSERALSSLPDSNSTSSHNRLSNYPQLLAPQTASSHHFDAKLTNNSNGRASYISGIARFSTKSLSSLPISKFTPSRRNSRQMDDDHEFYQTLSQPSTPCLQAQYISPISSALIQTPITPATPLEKPEFQTEYARQLFRGTSTHRSYRAHEDEDEELAPASSGSDLDRGHRRTISDAHQSRRSTSSRAPSHRNTTNHTGLSHDGASEISHSPSIPSERPSYKARSSNAVPHSQSPTDGAEVYTSHAPAPNPNLHSRSARSASNFRSSVRRKVDGLKVGMKLLKPSRIPADEARCLVSSDTPCRSMIEIIDATPFHAPSNHPVPAESLPRQTEPHVPHAVNRRPLSCRSSVQLRSFNSLHRQSSNAPRSPSPASIKQHPPGNFNQDFRHGPENNQPVVSSENDIFPASHSGTVHDSSNAKLHHPASQRLRPGRAPLESLILTSDSPSCLPTTSPASPLHQPVSEISSPSIESPCESPNLPSNAGQGQGGLEPEPIFDAVAHSNGPSVPLISLPRKRSPIIHESSNDIRRQIAREVNGGGSFISKRSYSDGRPAQPLRPSSSRVASSTNGSLNLSKNPPHRQLHPHEPEINCVSGQYPSTNSSYRPRSQSFLQSHNQSLQKPQSQQYHQALYSCGKPPLNAQHDHANSMIPATPCGTATQQDHKYQTPQFNPGRSISVSSTVQPRHKVDRRPPQTFERSPSNVEDDSDDDDEILCEPPPPVLKCPAPQSQRRFYVREDEDPCRSSRQVALNDERARPARKPLEPNRIDKNYIYVNDVEYTRQCVIGRGGSSKVFRAGMTDASTKLVAIKVVGLKQADRQTYLTFSNEIDLLKRLRGHDRIINLIDSSVDDVRRKVWLVMELGETDLNQLLNRQMSKPISFRFVKHIWEQMLEAVHAVHEQGIIHTDLKPANFVLVQGSVKIIDFGIAKAIPADTTNISRETQIGTANYMSPEALMMQQSSHGDHQTVKMGRATDVWALGCILYQMVYGHTPFSKLDTSLKVLTIRDPNHKIDYPEFVAPIQITPDGKKVALLDHKVLVEKGAICTIKSCLAYKKEDRSTIPELLQDEFLLGSSEGHTHSSPPTTTASDGAITIQPGMLDLIIQKSWDWYARRTANGGKLTDSQKKKFMASINESVQSSQ